MKISHILLVGGGIAAFAFRDSFRSFIEKQTNVITEKVSSYAASKVDIKPYKLPKIGLDLGRREVKLSGSIYVENKSNVSLSLETYQIEVTLEKGDKFLSLGKTPLLHPRVTIGSNSKTKVGYRFGLLIKTISSLIADKRDLENYDLFINLKGLRVSGFNIPAQKIAITSKWRTILSYVKDPTNLLNLIKF